MRKLNRTVLFRGDVEDLIKMVFSLRLRANAF